MSTRTPSPDSLDLARHAAGIQRLAERLVGSHDAEDLAQEAMIRGLERPPPKGYTPAGWLRGIVRNVAREHRRSEGRRVRREARVRPRSSPNTDVAEAAGQVERVRVLADALARLPEPYRAVLYWRYFADMQPMEIAAMLGEPAATVRTRLKRATDKLRSDLDTDHGGDGIVWRAVVAPLAAFSPAAKGVAVASTMHWSATTVLVLLLIGLGIDMFAWAPWTDSEPQDNEASLPAQHSDEAATLIGRATKDPPNEPKAAEGRSLTVTVIDLDTGEPIPGARLRVYRQLLGMGMMLTTLLKQGPVEGDTDDRGEVRLHVMDVGPLAVHSSAKAFLYQDSVPVPPTLGNELEVTVRVKRGEVLAGQVVLPDGTAPTASVELHFFVHRHGTSGPGHGSDTTTTADGTFLAEGLHPGAARISAVHTEGGRRYVAKTMVQTTDSDVRIELHHPVRGDRVQFDIRLQDTAGNPVEAKGLRVIGRKGHSFQRHDFNRWSGSSAEVKLGYDPSMQLFVEVYDVTSALGAVLHGPVSINEPGVTVTLSAGRTLNGVVRGPEGQVVAGVGIAARAVSVRAPRRNRRLHPRSFEDGRARSLHARTTGAVRLPIGVRRTRRVRASGRPPCGLKRARSHDRPQNRHDRDAESLGR